MFMLTVCNICASDGILVVFFIVSFYLFLLSLATIIEHIKRDKIIHIYTGGDSLFLQLIRALHLLIRGFVMHLPCVLHRFIFIVSGIRHLNTLQGTLRNESVVKLS